ncbi:MAG: imidazole glycerol phosphate synthase subunit HisH [Oscillospiraceae bacterium]|nr:imidazole glycerol phosphate synthase subunit HisH [Oscillospiraceae bacterium]
MLNGFTAVIDYGVGNLKSVTNAMDYVGLKTEITAEKSRIESADAIILPGVGAFPDAFERLRDRGLPALLREQARKKPILGICLGMQLLFDGSSEVRDCPGLGFIPGWVRRMETPLKLPHIGWNDLKFPNASPLFRGLTENSYVYFVHTYAGKAKNPEDVIAVTEYGTSVMAAVARGNVYGCQFHPEKSGEIGLQILKNFGGMMG